MSISPLLPPLLADTSDDKGSKHDHRKQHKDRIRYDFLQGPTSGDTKKRYCDSVDELQGRPTGDDTQIRERPRCPIVGLFVPTPGHHDDTVRRWITRYGNIALCNGRDGVAKRGAHPIPCVLG